MSAAMQLPQSSTAFNFYRLGFGAQMIVWAVRGRLHLLAEGTDDANVAEAFRSARLNESYAALVSIVDLLLCTGVRIELHGVGCPRLSPLEVSLLNALAYLQADQESRAQQWLAQLLGGPALRFAWPAVRRVAADFRTHALMLAPLEGAWPAVAVPPAAVH
jgi:hypothetical protein